MKQLLLTFVLLAIILTSCSSLETKYSKVDVGSSRSEVLQMMGPAPYEFTHENVEALRYAVIGGFGFCDYREFYIYKDTVVYKNEYNRASIAGCTAGLKDIDWERVFIAVNDFDGDNPDLEESNTPAYIEELKALSTLRDDGILTEEEFQKQKAEILARK